MKNINIFFSWASEHLENKRFILDTLEQVKQKLSKTGIILNIQESTSDLPGFVKIDDVIFQRIEKCDFFVADLSPIGVINDKHIVNPNVCYEMGHMLGRHGVARIFGLYNEKSVENPSKQLPFDFSHNRVMRFKINKDESAKKNKMDQYANLIHATIIEFDSKGDLNSSFPLKEHDIMINDVIVENMEKFKGFVHGFTERLDIYNGADIKNNIPGEYDFLMDFDAFLSKTINMFSDSSLEIMRKDLFLALRKFELFQSIYTHEYFDNNLRCTKRYFILEHPGRCNEFNLPIISDGDEGRPEMKVYVEEDQEYRQSAFDLLECYNLLQKRYIHLCV